MRYSHSLTLLAFAGTTFLAVSPAVALPAPPILVDSGVRFVRSDEDQRYASAAFDGTDWFVVWEDERLDPETTDICGSRVSTAGQVRERFSAVRQPAGQYVPRLARGADSQVLLVYEGWTATYHGRRYDADHIWGKFSPLAGIGEVANRETKRVRVGPTIVRGVLELPQAASHKPQAASLLDVSGRKVLDLKPGPNDLSRLAPGIYFVREEGSRGQGFEGSSVRRVVVTR